VVSSIYLLSFFFPRLISAVADWILPYFHTRCSVSAVSPHMSLQYCELRPTSGWDRFVSLEHPS